VKFDGYISKNFSYDNVTQGTDEKNKKFNVKINKIQKKVREYQINTMNKRSVYFFSTRLENYVFISQPNALAGRKIQKVLFSLQHL
jgi:effector-binding domain-containing protein